MGEVAPLKTNGPQNLSRAGVPLDEAPGVGDARLLPGPKSLPLQAVESTASTLDA